MRKLNHIILNFENIKPEAHKVPNDFYWALNFIDNEDCTTKLLNNVDFYKKFKKNKQLKKQTPFLKEEEKYTTKLSTTHPVNFMKDWERQGIIDVFKPVQHTEDPKTKKFYLKYSRSKGRDSYMYIQLSSNQYYKRNLKRSLTLFQKTIKSSKFEYTSNYTNVLERLINANVLRKERLYTKLKYSRSPAYDIVSGGSAALLSGFIGFLVSEKFGFELVDSGDFWYFFMYCVFASFSLRPLIFTSDSPEGFAKVFFLRNVLKFYTDLSTFILKKFK